MPVNKVNSLKELGFKVEPTRGTDANGNEWLYRVRGPEPVFFIKKTKRGKLLAFRTKDAAVDSTINGLYDFTAKGEGADLDLIGKRASPQAMSSNTGKQTRKAA